ncbi:PLP-dependent transferase [Pyronema omphalodes]|nr:PLP-dependent transferase [Pyronema omphalodes]
METGQAHIRMIAQQNADRHAGLGAYFLGPAAEGRDQMLEYITQILDNTQHIRQFFRDTKGDPPMIPNDIHTNAQFQLNKARFDKYLDILHKELLGPYSVPFWSPRYSGHMCMDTSMPATLGYFATMLYNPNNVSVEASPITTVLELEAGKQLCKLLGFRLAPGTRVYGFDNLDSEGVPEKEPEWQEGEPHISSWGHITSGGTVANIEALWAARNLKFYPLALRNAMRKGEELHYLEDKFKLKTCSLDELDSPILKTMKEITAWELLNIQVDDVLDIPRRLYEEHNISPTTLQRSMDKHGIQNVGQSTMTRIYAEHGETIKPMKVLVASTNHYSWPKACALTGIGSENMISVPIDDEAKIDIQELRFALAKCLENQEPVCAVIGIVGSTEEGAVDDIGEIVTSRYLMEANGLTFAIHVDAAWGGYFRSLYNDPVQPRYMDARHQPIVLTLGIRESVNRAFQYISQCDSVTIDPHKSGYVPYAAGALCYRNEKMRYLLTWSSPYISRDNEPESIGVYGVEGSKPGAAAAAVWLSNCVIGMGKKGYGALLGEALFTSSMFSAYWAAMKMQDKGYKNSFKVVPFNKLPENEEESHQFIRENIIGKRNEEIMLNSEALKMLHKLGSDLTINCFAVNFEIGGEMNDDVEIANRLNSSVVKRMSTVYPRQNPTDVDFFLSSTEFRQSIYRKCANTFKQRLGLEIESGVNLFVLRNVVMSPYTTTDGFIEKLSDAFGKIVDDEISRVLPFSDPAQKKKHRFLVQGGTNKNDSIYLVYLSQFFMANANSQLILRAILDSDSQDVRTKFPDYQFFLETAEEMAFSDLVGSTNLKATLVWKEGGEDKNIDSAASNMSIVINKSLKATEREKEYPELMPFYLYSNGQEDEGVHISHILLKAPNVMLSADRLKMVLNDERKKEELHGVLGRGCVAITNKPELLCQPFEDSQTILNPKEVVEVLLFPDWETAKKVMESDIPYDKKESMALASAKLSGFNSVYADNKHVNDNGRNGRRWMADKNEWEEVEGTDGPGGLYQDWLKQLHRIQKPINRNVEG